MNKYFQAPWTIKDLLMGLSFTSLILVASVFILDYLNFNELITGNIHRTYIILGVFLLQWIILILPIAIITYRKKKFDKKSLGLRSVGLWSSIKAVIGAYAVFLGVSFLIVSFMMITGIKIPGYQVQEKILHLFSPDTLSLVTAGVIIVVLAPIVEELFFRGVILRTLVNRIGKFYGSIITAFLFAIFHLQWQSIIPVFILGLIINSIVIRNRSVLPAIYFHMFNNLIAFCLELMILKEIIKIDSLL